MKKVNSIQTGSTVSTIVLFADNISWIKEYIIAFYARFLSPLVNHCEVSFSFIAPEKKSYFSGYIKSIFFYLRLKEGGLFVSAFSIFSQFVLFILLIHRVWFYWEFSSEMMFLISSRFILFKQSYFQLKCHDEFLWHLRFTWKKCQLWVTRMTASKINKEQ